MNPYLDIEGAAWPADEATAYRRLDIEKPRVTRAADRDFLSIGQESLSRLAREAFHDISFFLRAEHLDKIALVAADSSASAAERFVASSLLRNAVIASEGVLPLCQDTGTATVYAWAGPDILLPPGADPAAALAEGAREAWASDALRFSVLRPATMLQESNGRDNLPAQVEAFRSHRSGMRLLFVAKGGGSSNKTLFFQEAPAILSAPRLRDFLRRRIPELGVSACPPYRLAVVVGGTSPELNVTVLKLATTGALDGLAPAPGGGEGIFRCPEWEAEAMEAARDSGLGAQLGGTHLALDCRVIRLSRHAASCPVSIGVSCNAHRNARALVTSDGFFLEELERDPAGRLGATGKAGLPAIGTRIDLDAERGSWLEALRALRPGDLALLTGTIAVARDAAHARVQARIDSGEPPPEWMLEHPVCYAGPSRTPAGSAIGSFGPTTAGRMDAWAPALMDRGASLVTLAKGNRSADFARACGRNGGVYLGLIGGAAALIAREHITSERVIEYPELGMEAVRLVTVRDLPAFVIVSARGGELYPR